MKLEDMIIGSVEIAGIIKKNKLTVHRWADTGKLPKPLDIGGVYIWDRSEVTNILKSLGYEI